ncbi:TPM domain-containing protein [Granulosicoccaceae sp. 1_MG-2023]|nr:TPM domain-containing protein [Granulosicoccaceae sp. 1_MG-2023]
MAFLTLDEKDKLRRAIAQAESATSAEIVTVIAGSSDSYRFIPVLWAALLALAVPGLNFIAGRPLDPALTYQLQILVFFLITLLLQSTALRSKVIPRSVRHQRAARAAREQFLALNLHNTAERNGVLIYVSVAEHYVEILTDIGVAERIDNQTWQKTVDKFVGRVKAGETFEGFMAAVDDCRQVLQQHFPASARNPNELPDHLVEL